MRAVHSKNTRPELVVRRAAHAMGYRFRLHRADLPGTPDLVFPGRRAVIFVHGCFWHRHEGCRRATVPATRTSYWLPKFERNAGRDRFNTAALEASGWRVMVVWECETKSAALLAHRLASFLH
jgi:DNA mismatch endonuclease (patch repair protein)